MERTYTAEQALELAAFVTVLGREAGNQHREAVVAVACSIRNRVDANLERWGHGWIEVINKPWQYSSMNGPKDDPNLKKNPNLKFAPWPLCLEVAEKVYWREQDDVTSGAQSYFDKSLDDNPPAWSTDGEYAHTIDWGVFHFFKHASA